VVVAIAIVRARDLFAAAMLFAIYSLLSAALFTVLDAGDVALTEAAVGAGISTILLLAVLALARRYEHPVSGHNWLALVVVTVTGAVLVYATLDMPEFGASDNPAQVHVGPYYTEQSYPDMGVPNMVAAVLASYRSIDTLGEGFVILTAGLAVFALLSIKPRRRRRKSDKSMDFESEQVRADASIDHQEPPT
jgi:multicomponent Na+:H+ antiporter subunit B